MVRETDWQIEPQNKWLRNLEALGVGLLRLLCSRECQCWS